MNKQEYGSNGKKMLSMRKLKEFALSKIPQEHPLKDVILAEKDYLTVDEYLAKLWIWLTLMDNKTPK